jgi:Apea-like HEPN
MAPLNEEPDWIVASGWQLADAQHPAGGGTPAYRAVFKTLRVAVPTVSLEWPNLRVRFGHGFVERGGMNLPGAIPARAPNRWLLPESGRLIPVEAGQFRYEPVINMSFHFAAWQNLVADVFFVELLLKTVATEPRTCLQEGRRTLASLKVMLELEFGSRLLGTMLTEEAGAVFDDWHFNRLLNTEQLGAESQLDVAGIQPEQIDEWAHPQIDDYMSRSETDRHKVGLASEWYWTAIHAEEPVSEFLHLWFAVEVLAMPNTTNIRSVRERLAATVGGEPADWEEFVGRLYGKRGRLAHGEEERQVTDAELANLRAVVEVLLQAEVGALDPDRATALRQRVGL